MSVLCFPLIPVMLLPRPLFIKILTFCFRTLYWTEKYILGLDYEVRGRENIPSSGAYLIAAKHYSAYETLKLHILFGDPAIVMKKELKMLPIWGWLAIKSDMIFVDRASRETGMKSIVAGAKHAVEQGRPIIIFPQGTRVSINDTVDDKPYKGGIIRMYDAAEVPIVPLAMNTGAFWARNAFFKYPGKVVFEFLPPIPAGRKGPEVMAELKDKLEHASTQLVQEALQARGGA
ncbi:MAG TPA: 1-acyl-sn-glycerol-3-phosphate acyltransferase [Alphaproteobacteria bacterium]|nr:1-acyl-sn-glycerol-3-phosphate acyltransferase [Alphaproteobacteria bacterium]HNS45309.1 1-acyl-sn-glycerol-3-phosphate acyltransferase [Alphaproteobacteria bacterium]